MDLLIRFWSEKSNQVVTRYLTSIFFGRAPALDLVQKLKDIREKSDLTWDLLYNLSCDGPNINKAIWREFNKELTKEGYHGLLLGVIYQLAFDLHKWFKDRPCKKLSDDINIEDQSVFLRHVNTLGKIENSSGQRRYNLLEKVVKTCLSFQNSNWV